MTDATNIHKAELYSALKLRVEPDFVRARFSNRLISVELRGLAVLQQYAPSIGFPALFDLHTRIICVGIADIIPIFLQLLIDKGVGVGVARFFQKRKRNFCFASVSVKLL